MTQAISRRLAQRSSRRQFFKFMGASSLGVGLFLSGTDAALGSVTGCVGCGGGPCNPCFSPVGKCDTVTGGTYICKPCSVGGGCPPGCQTSGEWFCCTPQTQCRLRCSECNCPAGCQNPSCHCFTIVPMPCRPTRHSGDQPCGCAQEKQPLIAA